MGSQSRPEDRAENSYDPDGIEVALKIARGAQNILPTPKIRNRRRFRKVNSVQLSGPRPDARDPKLIGDAMGEVISRRGWQNQLGVRGLLAQWDRLVGKTNAEHSFPESYADTILTIRCDSTVWAQSLRLMTPSLVKQLNSKLGQGTVTEVKVYGPTPPSWKHGRRSVPGRGPRDTYG